MLHRALRVGFGLSLLTALAACSADEGAAGEAGDESDLTSLTARQRQLSFEGMVYVPVGSTDEKILEVARKQTQTAFGALLHAEVAVQSREVQNVDRASFKKRTVTVIDASKPNDPGKEMLEVRYVYRDNAIVPVAMSRKTALSLMVLGQGAEGKEKDVVAICTKNDKEARDDADGGLLWYDFEPQRATCRRAMEKEQKTIDDESGSLADRKKMVPLSRVNRMFLPVTMQLNRADTATRATYPEYDRLYSGANESGVLTIVLLNGRLAHDHKEARKDDGYYEWMSALDAVFTAHPDFEMTKIEPQENVTNVSAEGKEYKNLSFKDFIQWTVYGRGYPAGMPTSSRDNLAKTIADRLDNHWVTFEKKTMVSIGGDAPKPLTIRIETQFGADEDPAPHRRALSRGDVVIYNGHSYIGYGPLDPSNFKTTSFTRGYQILFFDSCVSYNYYEKDFFTLKPNGSKDLDMITNGIEAPEYLSGDAEGKFISRLIDGSAPSYQTLLEAAKATDSLRVVDGEIDNTWRPDRRAIRFQ